MIFGTIKLWNQDRGWGFIEAEDGEEYFFNIVNVRKGQRVRERAKVKFDIEETQKGTEAIHVSLT
ncbi:MAG: hypothetical protein CMG25_05850 [Candidatus Marinimicrobia bacterium]|nr:hypothetical protein [Candidatus Neomarinimicrobiota bacterium]